MPLDTPRTDDPCTLAATRLAALLTRREASSRELVQAHLARIDAVDGRLHAYTQVFRERALADADASDRERASGSVRGPLHGLPVSVKECFDFAGEATTIGIPARKGRRATADA